MSFSRNGERVSAAEALPEDQQGIRVDILPSLNVLNGRDSIVKDPLTLGCPRRASISAIIKREYVEAFFWKPIYK